MAVRLDNRAVEALAGSIEEFSNFAEVDSEFENPQFCDFYHGQDARIGFRGSKHYLPGGCLTGSAHSLTSGCGKNSTSYFSRTPPPSPLQGIANMLTNL